MSRPDPDPWTCSFAEWTASFEGADFEETWREQLQWSKAREIVEHREQIMSSGRAVLDAVADCARAGLTMPPWLADEFVRRHQAIVSYRAATFDDPEAFGPTHPDLGRVPTVSQLRAKNAQRRAAPVLAALFDQRELPRTPKGYAAAAKLLHRGGLTPEQVRLWLPKRRRKGASKGSAPTADALAWANPFGVVKKKGQ